MKKLFWIILALFIVFIIIGSSGNNDSTGNSNSNESTDIWKIYAELDEFKNETGNHYVKNVKSFKGTFTNSAVVDEDAYLYIEYNDDGKVYLIVRTYSDKASSEVNTYYFDEYEITVLDESNTKHILHGVGVDDKRKIMLEDDTLVNILMNNDVIKIHGKETGIGSLTFLFTVEKDNFTEVYNECVGNDN